MAESNSPEASPRLIPGRMPPETRASLENFLKGRPAVELPAFLENLEATHGFYIGDGRAGREIVVGFPPAFVVFTIPVWPDGPRRYKDGVFFEPPLHAQPEHTERGFVVNENLNPLGGFASYVVWREPSPQPKR